MMNIEFPVVAGFPPGLHIRVVHHHELIVFDTVLVEPRFSFLAVFLQPAGDEPADPLVRSYLRSDSGEELEVVLPVIVFRFGGVATENAVDVDAEVLQVGMVESIPLEHPRTGDDLSPSGRPGRARFR